MSHKPVSQYNPINSACRGLPCCTCSATYISQLRPLKSARDQCKEKALQSLWKHPQLAFIYTSRLPMLWVVYCWRNIMLIKRLTASFKPLPVKVYIKSAETEWRQTRFSKYLKLEWGNCDMEMHSCSFGRCFDWVFHTFLMTLFLQTPCFTSRSTGSYTPVSTP